MHLIKRIGIRVINTVLKRKNNSNPKRILTSFLHHDSSADPKDGLSDENKEIYDLALDFAKNEMAPNMRKWDAEHIFPRETLRHAAALGFGAIYCTDKYGGSHMGRLQASIIFEALAQGCASTTAYISIHNMCAWMIDTYGSEALRSRQIPQLASMQNFASYCLTEPDSGSDASSLKTTAVRKGDEFVLNGTKSFISGAGESDVYLIMSRTGVQGPKGISCVLVEADRTGISFGKLEDKVGWCSHPARQVFLEDVVVPETNLIGLENQGFSIAMKGLNGGRVNVSSVSVGAATASMEAAREHLHVRKQFNKPLKDFQYLQFLFAEMASNLVASRLMIRHAASAIDNNAPNTVPLCSMAKLFATEACSKICDHSMQMFGGYGYLKEYPVQQYYRDIRLHHIIEGTNEMMRLLVARDVLNPQK